ncbi:MAG TPA: tRNA (adenosine(37)-N6)-threonylcarbamoyltransferase complex dimerization subunit type 1 TsaB [Balneolaceae bacterium]|nr:tRNA (adenosine(37)-N6)-threonylcarbamoyltransferase complex dimerization subunit type 1 TsaB [Balneolaceae bacterium]|tara:strand:- start:188849 stop:189526 length:678 start_codon:yes stop_codon:yes gene_type:complete
MILAYETSTQVCSVAFLNNEGEIFQKRITGRSVHSDHVFLFTEELINEHAFNIGDLEAVLVSNGPGSYTGLRIAASAIKGLLFQQNIPLFACNTLAGFASSESISPETTGTIHSIIDARRTHVYHQSFIKNDVGDPEAKTNATVMEIKDFEAMIKDGDVVIGTGLHRLNKELLSTVTVMDDAAISAGNLIKLYQQSTAVQFCKRTEVEALDPEYITSNQVNNSPS